MDGPTQPVVAGHARDLGRGFESNARPESRASRTSCSEPAFAITSSRVSLYLLQHDDPAREEDRVRGRADRAFDPDAGGAQEVRRSTTSTRLSRRILRRESRLPFLSTRRRKWREMVALKARNPLI